MLSEPHTNMNASERVLIAGEDGEEKALLFRAIGGLWPWGSGRITHPARDTIMFMPVRAYIPPGSLRDAVAYPHQAHAFEAPAVVEALAAVGLGHLEPHLDIENRWDRDLTDDEKQCLAFARSSSKTALVVVHDALDALDRKSRAGIGALFSSALAERRLDQISAMTSRKPDSTRTSCIFSWIRAAEVEPERETEYRNRRNRPSESVPAK